MTRKLYNVLLLAAVFLPVALTAQTDTLLFEDFQGNWEDRYIQFYDDGVYGNDSIWINFDLDGAPNAQNDFQNWYIDLAFESPDSIGPADSNFVAASVSWMADPSIPNLNWMILPPVEILDGQVTLSWKSAPFQGPRYTDGYKVLLSTEEIDPLFGTYTDTLFVAAEMLTPLPDGAYDINDDALQADSFLWSPGYIHADRYMLTEYFTWDSTSDLFDPLLEPHTVSLAAYAGQTVYIGFLHDSFDDNILEIDDILVEGVITGTREENGPIHALFTYPNPVDNFLNVLFELETSASVRLGVFDMSGRQMLAMDSRGRLAGEQNLKLDLRRLPVGMYNLVLDVEGQQYSRKVVKR